MAEGDLRWHAEALREVAPRRGSKVLVAHRPDPVATYAAVQKAFAAAASALDAGRGEGDDARLDAVRAAFTGKPKASLDLDVQAAACALVAPPLMQRGDTRHTDFVRYWAAVEGAAFALRAYARAEHVRVGASVGPGYSVAKLWLAPSKLKSTVWWRAKDGQAWRALREAVLAAGEAERASLEALAEELRAGGSLRLRAALACAFEREDWAEHDRQAVLDASASLDGHERLALVDLAVVSPSHEVAESFLHTTHPTPWPLAGAVEKVRFDLVARYGAALVPFLVATIGGVGPQIIDTARSLATALACVVTPEVVRFFVSQLGNKDLRTIAATYLAEHGDVTLAAVAEIAAGKAATAEAAKTMLRSILSAHPELASTVALAPAARALVDGMRADAAPRVEASPDELPAVLRDPPWLRAQKLAPPKVVEGLEVLACAEATAWKPGEREAAAQRTGWMREQPERRDETLASIAAANSGGVAKHSWHRPNAMLFTTLAGADSIAAFNGATHENYAWAYYDSLPILAARHELAVLPGLLRVGEWELAGVITAARRLGSTRLAPMMAEAFVRLKKSRGLAGEWLATFPEIAAVGLVPAAVGKPGPARAHAEAALRHVAQTARATVEEVAARYGAEAAAAIAAVLDFDPLLVLPKKLPVMPFFFKPAAFARPLLAGRKKALPLASVEAIAVMLAISPAGEPYPGLAAVKETCDARSLAEFAWDLFQAWLVGGAPAKEAWAFQGLAVFGDDACARKLTPLVRAWPGEGGHARAVTGLDVLAAIGTDVALMHLHGIAQKVKFKGLQAKASEKIDQIAEARGFTAEELADRLVPDLGLGDDGSGELDFGARTFRIVFDESLKPAVLDAAGKRAAELPKPNKSDDAERAKAAVERWKVLKKDAKAIAQGQLVRLELAMCSQRRWRQDVWRPFLLEHPLLVHLVRRLVWGVYDGAGALEGTFRVAEDDSLAGQGDDAFSLPEGAEIGIVHRLEAGEELTTAWAQIFADYEILQPFDQLARAVARPTDAEKDALELTRVNGLRVPTGKVLGLDARGWHRGPPQDAGVVGWYEKPIGDHVVTLELDPGIFTGMVSESPEQTLGAVIVNREGGGRWFGRGGSVAMGALAPVVFSELVRDLDSLRA